jgi:hypothetical protein
MENLIHPSTDQGKGNTTAEFPSILQNCEMGVPWRKFFGLQWVFGIRRRLGRRSKLPRSWRKRRKAMKKKSTKLTARKLRKVQKGSVLASVKPLRAVAVLLEKDV